MPGLEEITQDFAANGGGGSQRSGDSALERIKQRRERIAADKTLTMQVPRFEGDLWVRYRSIPRDEFNALAKSLAKTGEAEALDAVADLLIRCCQEVLVREEPGAELEPINPDDPRPTTFSSGNLAEMIGAEADSARDTVFAVFSPGGLQPLAASQHADALVAWLQGRTDEIDRVLLGE